MPGVQIRTMCLHQQSWGLEWHPTPVRDLPRRWQHLAWQRRQRAQLWYLTLCVCFRTFLLWYLLARCFRRTMWSLRTRQKVCCPPQSAQHAHTGLPAMHYTWSARLRVRIRATGRCAGVKHACVILQPLDQMYAMLIIVCVILVIMFMRSAATMAGIGGHSAQGERLRSNSRFTWQ